MSARRILELEPDEFAVLELAVEVEVLRLQRLMGQVPEEERAKVLNIGPTARLARKLDALR